MNVQEARFRSAVAEKTSEQFFLDRSSFPQRTMAVATAAAAEAEAVDRDARFPQGAIDAARQQKLLGVQIPQRSRGAAPSTPPTPALTHPPPPPPPSPPT